MSWISTTIAAVTVLVAARFLTLVVYRLIFHPLRNVPGPRLAAASWLYEIYFDLYLGGQFFKEIGRLHERYGPIVRVTPNEVHVNDPELIDLVYPGGGTKINKDPYLMRQFGLLDSGFSTIDHDLHRLRRGALSRYFSKGAVSKFEPYIRDTAEKLCCRLLEHHGSGPVTISCAFSSFATDVIAEYCFGKSFGYVDRPNFLPNLQAGLDAMGTMNHFLKQAPWMHKIMRLVPQEQLLKSNPGMVAWIQTENDCKREVAEAKARLKNNKSDKEYPTVIDELLQSSLPDEEKSDDRMTLEAMVLINAAAETTAWNLSLCTFYLLHQPGIMHRLRKELQAIQPSPSELPSLTKLEQIPYFSGVVAETLRHTYGPIARLPRIRPTEAVKLTSIHDGKPVEYVVPPGYTVSMTSIHVHKNPDIFPDPHAFAPERWLDAEGNRRKDLDKYILSFSRGTRQCLGLNLAYAEMSICIAAITLRLGDKLELYETTRENDIEAARDVFAMRPKKSSKGIRVLVR